MIRYILLAALFGLTATAASAQEVLLDTYGCGRFVQVYQCPPPVYYQCPPPAYYPPPSTIVQTAVKHDLYYDGAVRTKWYVKAKFPEYNYRCEIPVINGYLPSVSITTDSYGRVSRLALDYRAKEFYYTDFSQKDEIVYSKNGGTTAGSSSTKRPAPKVSEFKSGGVSEDPMKKPAPKFEYKGTTPEIEKRPAPKFEDKGTPTPLPPLDRPAPTKDQRIEDLLKNLRGNGEWKSSSGGVTPSTAPAAPKVTIPSTGVMRPSDITQPEVDRTKKFPRYDD